MSIRIAYDHQAFVMQSYGGISRYFTCLAQELIKKETTPHIFAPLHKNVYLSGMPKELVTGKYLESFPPKTASLVNIYNKSKLSKSLYKFKADVLHETYYTVRSVNKTSLPVVLTVYDMIHELLPAAFPEHDSTASYKRDAVMRADHIICISESTRRDLIEIYNVPENKTSVIHLASNISSPSDNLRPNWLDEKPFILFVGQRGGYKNFINFISAIARSNKLIKEFNIVCFGGGAFTDKEKDKLSLLGFDNNQVIQISGDDDLLARLYFHAGAFVCPSQYEGFGLPIVESMSLGCPVISSNMSSLPEVGGGAARYFDPYNIDEMSSVIEDTVFSESALESLRLAGKERASAFSWESCAQATLNVYSDFVKKN